MAMIMVEAARLQQATEELFKAAGASPEDAALIAQHLVEANLLGHDSHGVSVLPMYLNGLKSGGLAFGAALKVASQTPGTIIFDAAHGPGQVQAHHAMVRGIELARENGSIIVGVKNSHHIGRIGHYAQQCAAAGLASIHFVNVVAGPFVAPFGGTKARLGTNPIAIGLPRAAADPIILDFATSRLAAGKIRVYRNKGEMLPDGVLLTGSGEPTNDPAELTADPRGVMLPFGEHKGSGLALACELLAAALIGGDTQHGPDAPPGVVNSMLSILISPERMGTAGVFGGEMAKVLAWVQSENNDRPGAVLLPGDPERATRCERLDRGIPLDTETLTQIVEAARTLKLPETGFVAMLG